MFYTSKDVLRLLLVTGFSSIFICDFVLEDHNNDPDLYQTVTVVLKSGNITVDLKDAFHKCRRNNGFHEAFALRRIMINNAAENRLNDIRMGLTKPRVLVLLDVLLPN
ncbi:hypothetical protein GCK32_017668 [Trichostrongylus colubriformis]|uniref:Uncharacterized protein n=1 Tax=Trichostrongylus colubriformis TaxID=6319 RepID=A0AAN8IBB5_TRICO